MADIITELDGVVDAVQLVEKTSKGGNRYHMIRLVIGEDNLDMLTPTFDTAKLLKQELELQKLRKQ